MSLTTVKWTVDDYHRMIEAGLLVDRKVELLQGEIVEMPPEGEPHACYSTATAGQLRNQLAGRATIRDAKPVTLPNNSEPEPDIAVVRLPIWNYLEHHPYPEDIHWLIEYANTTLAKDIGVKQLLYAEAGIREYWVVNLQDSQLEVFRDLLDGLYQTHLTLKAGTIPPLDFPDLSLEVWTLFSRSG